MLTFKTLAKKRFGIECRAWRGTFGVAFERDTTTTAGGLIRPGRLWVTGFFLVAFAAAIPQHLFLTNSLPDGEIETWIRFRKFTAKETTVDSRSGSGLTLRQLSDGKHLIQLIYGENGGLKDCEFVEEKRHVRAFLNRFKFNISHIISSKNISMTSLYRSSIPGRYRKWLDYSRRKQECVEMHENLRENVLSQRHINDGNYTRSRQERSLSLSEYLIMPGTNWCGHKNLARSYTDLGAKMGTDRCCRKHDHCKINIPGFTKKYRLFNTRPFTLSHCWCDSRSRRDLSNFLQIPGTQWCGKGYRAKKYTHLGGFSKTDRCCRRHDTACPYWISAYETKYGLFNWRLNTIMHCSCDERFRACLKMADTSDANLVGKLFFNVVQTKCFVLKTKKTCVKKSWWGKCLKKKFIKKAILRDNVSY